MPLKIYLADLTHTGKGIATEAMPLNIGLIASYAKKIHGEKIELRLFKYPEALLAALEEETPAIVGFSNYCWNHDLAGFFCQRIKKATPQVVTVFGGTNFPFSAHKQEAFLRARPWLDCHVVYEGEVAFAGFLSRFLAAPGDVFSRPLSGIAYVRDGRFSAALAQPRLAELDSVPSPYASGLLDDFFDGKLTPLLETTRGCPFHCNFCNAGDRYFDKVARFSSDYVRAEFSYVARKAQATGIGHLTLADNNFGMHARDVELTTHLVELRDRYQWPNSMTAWTGKNSKERVIAATRQLGSTLSVSMSVQSLAPEVLSLIERDNIQLDQYRAIADELNRQERPQHAELIIPLPAETLESHVRALNELLDSSLRTVQVHTLQLLHGTPYRDDDDFVARWGYQRPRFRVVPMDFGRYANEIVLDVEAVAVESASFSFADYLQARQRLLLIELSHNGALFVLLRQLLIEQGIRSSQWVEHLYQSLGRLGGGPEAVFAAFLAETKSELWLDPAELKAFYRSPENYQRLVDGEAGGNVLYKHKALMYAAHADAWLDFVFLTTAHLCPELGDLVTTLHKFARAMVHDAYSFSKSDAPARVSLDYDVLRWRSEKFTRPLATYRLVEPKEWTLKFTVAQLAFMREGARRYGENLMGMVKLLQRSQGGDQHLLRQFET